jgi:hypothetical protein
MNLEIYWCSGKLSRYHRKLAEQDLINSNKLLDESQDIRKRGVGNDVITKDLIWSREL